MEKSKMETLNKILFWDYRIDIPVEELSGKIKAQRYVDFWPYIYTAYKKNEIDINEIKKIVEIIHQYGPVKYCEGVREYVITKLIERWF